MKITESMQLSLEGEMCSTFLETKKCAICGETKARDEFHKNIMKKDGLHSECKKCSQARMKVYRETHREEIKKHDNEYHKAHRDERNEYNGAYSRDNGEKIKIYKQKVRENDPQLFWSKKTLSDHKCRGIFNKITIDELVEMARKVTHCPICDVEINWMHKGKSCCMSSPSLDRKFNGKRISLKTCWIICRKCNIMKHDLPMPEYVAHCKRVVERFGT